MSAVKWILAAVLAVLVVVTVALLDDSDQTCTTTIIGRVPITRCSP